MGLQGACRSFGRAGAAEDGEIALPELQAESEVVQNASPTIATPALQSSTSSDERQHVRNEMSKSQCHKKRLCPLGMFC